ncbi:unnamed protein product [Peniophora sp. CBMAI 1063]|nr:unnamed protein product [Peniophora sp. CBMAI 1063]
MADNELGFMQRFKASFSRELRAAYRYALQPSRAGRPAYEAVSYGLINVVITQHCREMVLARDAASDTLTITVPQGRVEKVKSYRIPDFFVQFMKDTPGPREYMYFWEVKRPVLLDAAESEVADEDWATGEVSPIEEEDEEDEEEDEEEEKDDEEEEEDGGGKEEDEVKDDDDVRGEGDDGEGEGDEGGGGDEEEDDEGNREEEPPTFEDQFIQEYEKLYDSEIYKQIRQQAEHTFSQEVEQDFVFIFSSSGGYFSLTVFMKNSGDDGAEARRARLNEYWAWRPVVEAHTTAFHTARVQKIEEGAAKDSFWKTLDPEEKDARLGPVKDTLQQAYDNRHEIVYHATEMFEDISGNMRPSVWLVHALSIVQKASGFVIPAGSLQDEWSHFSTDDVPAPVLDEAALTRIKGGALPYTVRDAFTQFENMIRPPLTNSREGSRSKRPTPRGSGAQTPLLGGDLGPAGGTRRQAARQAGGPEMDELARRMGELRTEGLRRSTRVTAAGTSTRDSSGSPAPNRGGR